MNRNDHIFNNLSIGSSNDLSLQRLEPSGPHRRHMHCAQNFGARAVTPVKEERDPHEELSLYELLSALQPATNAIIPSSIPSIRVTRNNNTASDLKTPLRFNS
ncbi:expressed unknown protein [Seminavis robusta]|uniref:Uncharacterized protein n=1 Tax=Seminavis robusta TaxID=568900 RepID=A0A9N8E7H1_9STRA|nr:expressed unknown protein [Seminavis robusta]|eukprot:Sro734_g194641.1  (103) ;mRNA; r:13724-14032